MLQQIRDRSGGIVAFILLGVLALAFAVWGIDFNFASQTFAAQVNGENITVQQARNVYQAQLQRYSQFYTDGIPEEVQSRLREDVLRGLARNELLVQHTQGEGYRVGDQQLAGTVRSMELFHQDGKFNMDTYLAQLARQGYSDARFLAETRETMAVSQLQSAITDSAFVTRSERLRRAAIENESRDVAFLRFPVSAYIDDIVVSDADIEAEFQATRDNYRTQETVTIDYLELRQADVASEVGDEEVRANYDADLETGRFEKPEQRKARHILIRVDKDLPEDEALAKANDLLTRIRGGEDFAKLASENSADPGSAAEGGSLDWSEKTAFVGAFGDTLFSMSVGAVSEPVRTSFGYHIIELEDVRVGGNEPYENVAEQLRVELAADIFNNTATEIDEQVFNNAGSLQPAATAFDLEIQSVEGVTRNGGTGIAALSPAVINAAFSDNVLIEGNNSGAVQIASDHVAFLRVRNHQPSKLRDLEDVRETVETSIKTARARDEAMAQAKAAMEAFRNGAEFGALESAADATFVPAVTSKRNAPAALPAQIFQAAFNAARPEGDKPTIDVVTLSNGDAAVFAVSNVQPGSISDDTARNEQLARQAGFSDFQAYVAALLADAKVQIRPDQLQ